MFSYDNFLCLHNPTNAIEVALKQACLLSDIKIHLELDTQHVLTFFKIFPKMKRSQLYFFIWNPTRSLA
jgi:hypothetical protein